MGNSFEDQITSLDQEMMPVLSKEIYKLLSLNDYDYLDFPTKDFYKNFLKPLNILNEKRYIKLSEGAIYAPTPQSIDWISTKYRIYLCAFCEDQDKMARLTEIIDSRKEKLDSENLKKEIGLPEFVIKAMFEKYEINGRGKVYGKLRNQYCCNELRKDK